MKQAFRDRVRFFNKHVTNKVLIHLAGKKFGHFAILSHVGRKSGKLYKIPIIAEPIENGFVVALTYGQGVDWYKNVKARGACSIRWKHEDYHLTRPELIDKELGLLAFPPFLRASLRKAGTQDFLKLEIE